MDRSFKPFLWNFIETVQKNHDYTGGRERIGTESLSEENNMSLIEITYGS